MNAKPKLAASARHARPHRRRRRPRLLDAAVLWLLAAAALPALAQPKLGQGALLVATPDIGDPSWAETVILVLHHDSNGTLGVAINRPTVVEPQEVAPDLGELPGYSVFRGGPVGPTQLIFLAHNPPPGILQSAPMIVDGIYASGDLAALPRLAGRGDDRELRLYAGHVEWSPGQLDQEVMDGRWTVAAGTAERVFAAEPEGLWRRLLTVGEELLVDAG